LQAVYSRLRESVSSLDQDRYMAPDLEEAARLVGSGALTAVAGVTLPELDA
jgi:histidine ammonia-lyase